MRENWILNYFWDYFLWESQQKQIREIFEVTWLFGWFRLANQLNFQNKLQFCFENWKIGFRIWILKKKWGLFTKNYAKLIRKKAGLFHNLNGQEGDKLVADLPNEIRHATTEQTTSRPQSKSNEAFEKRPDCSTTSRRQSRPWCALQKQRSSQDSTHGWRILWHISTSILTLEPHAKLKSQKPKIYRVIQWPCQVWKSGFHMNEKKSEWFDSIWFLFHLWHFLASIKIKITSMRSFHLLRFCSNSISSTDRLSTPTTPTICKWTRFIILCPTF